MTLNVIGAGAGRTGTQSLKFALERLLRAPCYDMWDLLKNPDHVPVWEQALDGQQVDWDVLFADHRSTVDWTPPPSSLSSPPPTRTRSFCCPCVTQTSGGAASAAPWS